MSFPAPMPFGELGRRSLVARTETNADSVKMAFSFPSFVDAESTFSQRGLFTSSI